MKIMKSVLLAAALLAVFALGYFSHAYAFRTPVDGTESAPVRAVP
jgi:hypothetical protein